MPQPPNQLADIGNHGLMQPRQMNRAQNSIQRMMMQPLGWTHKLTKCSTPRDSLPGLLPGDPAAATLTPKPLSSPRTGLPATKHHCHHRRLPGATILSKIQSCCTGVGPSSYVGSKQQLLLTVLQNQPTCC